MASKLQHDGINDNVVVTGPDIRAEDFTLETKITTGSSASDDSVIVSTGTATKWLIANQAANKIRMRINSDHEWSATLAASTDYTIKIVRSSGVLSCYVDDVLLPGNPTDNGWFNFHKTGVYPPSWYKDIGLHYISVTVPGDSSKDRLYDARSTTSGSVLPETINGDNGALTSFPTDDSQWVDLGGGPAPASGYCVSEGVFTVGAYGDKASFGLIQSSVLSMAENSAIANRSGAVLSGQVGLTAAHASPKKSGAVSASASGSVVVATLASRVGVIASDSRSDSITLAVSNRTGSVSSENRSLSPVFGVKLSADAFGFTSINGVSLASVSGVANRSGVAEALARAGVEVTGDKLDALSGVVRVKNAVQVSVSGKAVKSGSINIHNPSVVISDGAVHFVGQVSVEVAGEASVAGLDGSVPALIDVVCIDGEQITVIELDGQHQPVIDYEWVLGCES